MKSRVASGHRFRKLFVQEETGFSCRSTVAFEFLPLHASCSQCFMQLPGKIDCRRPRCFYRTWRKLDVRVWFAGLTGQLFLGTVEQNIPVKCLNFLCEGFLLVNDVFGSADNVVRPFSVFNLFCSGGVGGCVCASFKKREGSCGSFLVKRDGSSLASWFSDVRKRCSPKSPCNSTLLATLDTTRQRVQRDDTPSIEFGVTFSP